MGAELARRAAATINLTGTRQGKHENRWGVKPGFSPYSHWCAVCAGFTHRLHAFLLAFCTVPLWETLSA